MRSLVLFSLLILGGESVLLPALRLNLRDERALLTVTVLAIAATVVSDLFWYWVGRYGAMTPIVADSPLVRRVRFRPWVSAEQFEAHWKKLLLLSKFVYGTRTPAQLICGATRRRLVHYLGVNTLGTTLLIVYLHGLILLFARGFGFLGHWSNVVATIAATVLLSFLVGKAGWFVFRHHSRL